MTQLLSTEYSIKNLFHHGRIGAPGVLPLHFQGVVAQVTPV
jgi:hypothetical protein